MKYCDLFCFIEENQSSFGARVIPRNLRGCLFPIGCIFFAFLFSGGEGVGREAKWTTKKIPENQWNRAYCIPRGNFEFVAYAWRTVCKLILWSNEHPASWVNYLLSAFLPRRRERELIQVLFDANCGYLLEFNVKISTCELLTTSQLEVKLYSSNHFRKIPFITTEKRYVRHPCRSFTIHTRLKSF